MLKIPQSSALRLYLAGSALTGAAHTVSFTLLARYLDAIGLSKTDVGRVLAADAWGKVLVALPAAWLLARRPARGVFVTAALVGGGAYALLPWVGNLRALMVLNLVAGFAMTLHYVAIAPFLFRHARSAERAGVFGTAEAVRTLAAVVGAFTAGRFVAAGQLELGGEARATAWAITAAGAIAATASLFYARIPAVPPELARDKPLLPVLRAHRGLLLRFAAPQFLVACGAGFCIPFLPLYFKDRFDLEPGSWGTLFAGGQVMMTIGFLATPAILKRLGFVRSIVTIELCSIPFFLLLAFTGNLPLAMFGFLMRGALMNSTHPLHKNFMMQATPPGAREVQIGINATLWGIGWVIGPNLAGRVLDATGDDYAVLMLATVGVYLVAASLTWILLGPVERAQRLSKGKRSQSTHSQSGSIQGVELSGSSSDEV
jgi:predicted MFS family arabinose efflux permease